MRWARRAAGGTGPGCKWGHTCNAVRSRRLVYAFGGYGRDECQTNDVHVFDIVSGLWSKPSMAGAVPSARDSHTCTTVGSKLYVFGGTDGTNPLDDLYVLDTASNAWVKPEVSGDVPAAREGHSAALVNDNLYVFGGCGKADDCDEVYFNDTYVLNTVTFEWKRLITTGAIPIPRDSHTCSSYKNALVVLGGEDANNAYLADVHTLDTETLVWKEFRTTGAKLVPRAGHATISHGKHLIVFGGFTDNRKLFSDLHVLDLLTGVWTSASCTNSGPSPRFSLAGDCVDADRGVLFFYGGCNEELEALDDIYYLDTELQRERDPSEPKLSMRKELKRRRQEYRIFPSSSSKPEEESCLQGAEAEPVTEKLFEARVSDVFHYGYTLEASIHGKLFRGLLFSCKPGFAHTVKSYLSRKKPDSERNASITISPEPVNHQQIVETESQARLESSPDSFSGDLGIQSGATLQALQ